jgi:hypothetical protein
MKFTEEDIEIVRNLLENGRYYLNGRFPSYKNPFDDEEWFINSIHIGNRYRNGKKDYIIADIYSNKLNNERCFENGYMHHTSRTLRLNDFLLQKRKYKLNKIKRTIK